ncbi:MAG TPA: M23 family metallopeptidase [Fibrobacteraceae bacterium]|nr:M23 family metallopeptidase [Fibrobacter sp.]HPW94510.1 M23 family metallopeptidase [Fibrobacteraceae bacterium]HQB64297.1 M23 family metallopeptidase [Fibrobacteraceae bacterium]
MKKIDIHFFPSNTEKPRSFRISLLRPIWWVIGALVAALGFILFSPIQIFDTITNGHLINLYRQNRQIEQTIADIHQSIQESEKQLQEASSLRDSSIKLSGLISPVADIEKDSNDRPSISQVFTTYKKFLDSLEKYPEQGPAIPISLPVKIKPIITNRFSFILDPFTQQELPHRGVDFAAVEGDTVYATGAGKVIDVRHHRGFGLTVKIEHTSEIRTFYAHLNNSLVRQGSTVKRGTPIAIVGKSGRSTGPSLHYEIRLQGQPINPEPLLIMM